MYEHVQSAQWLVQVALEDEHLCMRGFCLQAKFWDVGSAEPKMEPFGCGVIGKNPGTPGLWEGCGHSSTLLGNVKGSKWRRARQRVSRLRETGSES